MVIEVGGVKIRIISWREGIALSEELAKRVENSKYRPEVVVAISRGGLVPARIVSDVLEIDDVVSVGVKYWGLARKRAEKPILYHGVEPSAVRGRRALLVDEVTDTGHTLQLAKTILELMGAEVRTAVLHLKTTSLITPDYYVEKVNEWMWISYPWSRHEDYRELKKRGHDLSQYFGFSQQNYFL